MRRQSCQQDGAEQQRERAAPPGPGCASAHGGVSGAQSRFAGADCPAGQPCRPADRRAHCRADCRAPCRADFRMESVHVSPPFPCGSVCAAALFHAGGGDCPAGASPLASPGLNPGGAYSPNKKGTRRGACLVCRLPTLPFRKPQGGACFFSRLPILPLAFFTAPIPPPALAERSSPPGKGRLKFFHARGCAPCIPGLNPGGTYSPNKKGTRRGGLPCLPPADHAFPEAAGGLGGFGRLPALPLALFLAPIPPTPFPGGEGGD